MELPFIFYGYKLETSSSERNTFIQSLCDMNGMMKQPFQILNIVPCPHTVAESTLIIGFTPNAYLKKTMELAKELKEYIRDSPLLDELEVAEFPLFFCGVDAVIQEVDEFEDFLEESELTELTELEESQELEESDESLQELEELDEEILKSLTCD